MSKLHGYGICLWIFGMWGMFAASAVVAEDCRLARVASVEMTISKDGQVQIPVEINGIKVQMAVDVGGGLSAIWSGAVPALNLQPKDSIARGRLNSGAVSLTQTAELSGLKIANTQWLPFSVLVFPRNKAFPESLGPDDSVGFLGQTAFANLDLELDFQAHQLRLYSQNHCAGAIVYWARRYDVVPLQKSTLGNLYISMLVNGTPMSTSMSTMSPSSRLEEGAARDILGIDRASFDANGSDGCSHCQSINLKVEGLEIRNANVRIVNSVPNNCRLRIPKSKSAVAGYDCQGAYPLQIGVDVLSKLHLYYANAQKSLYFTDAKAGVSDSADTFGPAIQ